MKNIKNIIATIITLVTLSFNGSGQTDSLHIATACGDSIYTFADFWIDNNEIDTTYIVNNCDNIKFEYNWKDGSNTSHDLNEYLQFNGTVGDTIIKIVNNLGNVIIIKIEFDKTASVDENRSEVAELIAFPNPTIDNITVRFETNKTNMPISVFSLSGQLVYRDVDSRYVGRNEVSIPVSNLAQGMYLIQVGTATEHFVVE